MATITKPLTAVVHVLSVAFGYIANKIIPQGIRKAFNNEGPDGPFIPVTYIPLKDLTVDPKYQRLINTNFIRKAEEFKPEFVKPLSVFKRPDGTLVVVDGQHTSVLAATYVQDPEDFKLPCQVQVHPSNYTIDQCEKAEAKYFKEFNGTTFVRKAIETYKGHNRATSNLCKWSKPLNGGFIFGLAAAYSFLDNLSVTNSGDRYDNFNTFLNTSIKHYTIDNFTTNTAGPIQDILILEQILKVYLVLSPGHGWASIGEKSWSDWRFDKGIHGRKTANQTESEED